MSPEWATRYISHAKIAEYLLNPAHKTGRHKATFFRAFGFDPAQPDELISALLDHPLRNQISRTFETPFGTKLEVRCTLLCPDGREPCIVSVWLAPLNGAVRLVTAFPA